MEVKFDFYRHHLTAHGTNRASYQVEFRGGCLAGPNRFSGRAGGNARPLWRQWAASCCRSQLSGPNSIHKETVMSSITSLSPTSAAFPSVDTRARGHKHGWQMDSADAPTGAVQNLFGSLLQTAEKVIGLQSGPAAAAIAAIKSAGAIATHKQQPNGVQPSATAGTINANA
jgi:hypothetical protein